MQVIDCISRIPHDETDNRYSVRTKIASKSETLYYSGCAAYAEGIRYTDAARVLISCLGRLSERSLDTPDIDLRCQAPTTFSVLAVAYGTQIKIV
ncbi:hypothetical protein RvY_06561 [Ramazzottius varieornatus]|uniref:Uncharacterized protein n=1 Tax=Ramazzottius varieornatus TaxID=947166 RepID=A0A1D1V7Q0_RAMVA|nr:hypothetical protein RvY_06561 [Ramazzottius varieornatus]